MLRYPECHSATATTGNLDLIELELHRWSRPLGLNLSYYFERGQRRTSTPNRPCHGPLTGA